MAIPVLKLNLAPPPTLWRQHHETLGILALGLGALALLLAAGISVRKYAQASREGHRLVSISADAQRVAREQGRILESLRQIDASERAPRYKLAERIFLERTLPWSRLTAELERSLVQDVRVKTLQRVRTTDGAVVLKVRGEARSRASEVKFVEALQGNKMFAQVVLEREAERQGGGIDYDLSLPVAQAPPPYTALPVPPILKVDQFGRPLAKDAKVLRQISGGRPGSAPAPPPSPGRPIAPAPPRPAAPPPMPQPLPASPPPEPGEDSRAPRRAPRSEPRAPQAPGGSPAPRPQPPPGPDTGGGA